MSNLNCDLKFGPKSTFHSENLSSKIKSKLFKGIKHVEAADLVELPNKENTKSVSTAIIISYVSTVLSNYIQLAPLFKPKNKC